MPEHRCVTFNRPRLRVSQVRFAASKEDLIGTRGRRENQQNFLSPPQLGKLRHLIYIIGYELTKYQLFSVSVHCSI